MRVQTAGALSEHGAPPDPSVDTDVASSTFFYEPDAADDFDDEDPDADLEI